MTPCHTSVGNMRRRSANIGSNLYIIQERENKHHMSKWRKGGLNKFTKDMTRS